MSDPEKIELLRNAMEEIRELTMLKDNRFGQPIPKTHVEKVRDWALIQSVAARALRDTEGE